MKPPLGIVSEVEDRMEEDSCQDSGEEEDGKSQGVKENKTFITKSEHEELKNIIEKVMYEETLEDVFIELYHYLQSHSNVDIYYFVSGYNGWDDSRKNSKFIRDWLDWAEGEVQYLETESVQEKLPDDQSGDIVTAEQQCCHPEVRHRVVVFRQLGRLSQQHDLGSQPFSGCKDEVVCNKVDTHNTEVTKVEDIKKNRHDSDNIKKEDNQLVTPLLSEDSGSVSDFPSVGCPEHVKQRKKRKRSLRSRTIRRQRLLDYHQKMFSDRNLPLSNFQKKERLSSSLSSGWSKYKRNLEGDFNYLAGDQQVVVEENLCAPGESQGGDRPASSKKNQHLLRGPSLCQEPDMSQAQRLPTPLPPPHSPISPSPCYQPYWVQWVWQLSSAPGVLPAYCPGCAQWGTMSMVHLCC